MKLFSVLFYLLLFFQIIFIGCESKEEEKILPERKFSLPPEQEQQKQIIKQGNINPKAAQEIIDVIKENLNACNNKDIQRVLDTIHPDSPQLKSTKEGMDFVFQSYDLQFIIEEIDVVEIEDDNAKVYYVQFTTNTGPQQFADKRAAGYHIMKKFDGKWKIFKTESL